MERDYLKDFRDVLTDGQQLGVMAVDDVNTTAFAIVTLCEYVYTWFNAGGKMSVAAVANRYEGLVRNMVRATTAAALS